MKPTNIKAIYDNGGESLDRYTIVLDSQEAKTNFWDCLCTSETGAGFSQFSYCMQGLHLGKKVTFESLSPELQKHIVGRLQ